MSGMKAPVSFLEKYGGATANVDFSEGPSLPAEVLPMPEPTDSLQTLSNKMRALAEVVERGASVARFTGMLGTPQGSRDAEEVGKLRMTDLEREMFDHWAAGGVLPPIDWDKDMKKAPSSGEGMRRAQRRAQALNMLYKTDKAQPQHVMWYQDTYATIIPLLVAVTKVIGAQTDFLSGQDKLTDNEVAEVQTIGRATGTTYATINAIQEEVHKLLANINRSKDVLQAREHAIKAKNPEYKKKRSPENDRRGLLGKRKIGVEVDFGQAPEPSRRARRDLAQGIRPRSVIEAAKATAESREKGKQPAKEGNGTPPTAGRRDGHFQLGGWQDTGV
ncbi:unknown [Curvularia thermal tolerance virus]|uniref:Uncharacterized protein n=1 Tax=Curvularia thermal tolerance virus TaxID=421976 RepID=A3EYA9_9VIRU|nr:hypothetical protein CThTV_RNA2gp1 [Curvularia thermal tolerance virus]ABM92660.1 unknown [Curvularia thermal tolerance virus]